MDKCRNARAQTKPDKPTNLLANCASKKLITSLKKDENFPQKREKKSWEKAKILIEILK